MAVTRLLVDKEWNGTPVGPNERVCLELVIDGDILRIAIDAPFHDDAPPESPPGPTPALWNFEVVELFLLGANARYLELEFGPFGHYLALELRGARNVVGEHRLEFATRRGRGRWSGEAVVLLELLPPGCTRINAYAIHGSKGSRRYLACHPVPGDEPDFHRLQLFGTWNLISGLTESASAGEDG